MLIVDGTPVPIRDHTIAERSKNYQYSTNHQVAANRARGGSKIICGTALSRHDEAGRRSP
ncbi:hypothetical protein ASE09_25780 [Streptomyces sp. Root66D1]|nr:hypothetical protein ASD33_28970 [Streptomyces sp. Root1304]KRA96919.1 hypothetical protein ASE09_25780 [Streptomyces sp. Root66D1]